MDADKRTLVIRAQGGDIEAFSDLVASHWVHLVRFARSVVGSGDAEDLVQNGLVKAWKKLSALRDPGAFSAWLLRIVSRQCFSYTRRNRRLVPLIDIDDPSDPAGPGRIEAIDVERVLAALPARQRAVMHLTVMEGMSDSEIGEALHITAASVRSHRRRAKENLNGLLRSFEPLKEVANEIAGR
jgi:RNA polymerase sigma-70 factor (ECF subfamily)